MKEPEAKNSGYRCENCREALAEVRGEYYCPNLCGFYSEYVEARATITAKRDKCLYCGTLLSNRDFCDQWCRKEYNENLQDEQNGVHNVHI